MPSGYADLGPCIAPSCRRDLAGIVAVFAPVTGGYRAADERGRDSCNSYVVCVIAGELPGHLIAPLTKSFAADTSSGGAGRRAEEVR